MENIFAILATLLKLQRKVGEASAMNWENNRSTGGKGIVTLVH
jgi:hypothetical protein